MKGGITTTNITTTTATTTTTTITSTTTTTPGKLFCIFEVVSVKRGGGGETKFPKVEAGGGGGREPRFLERTGGENYPEGHCLWTENLHF